MQIGGRASAARTAETAGPWGRALGRTGWTVGPFGFGCYRIDEANPAHTEALGRALGSGAINLIDTSTNYGGGRSERAVGRALARLEPAAREGIVVVTKVGYWQGELLDALKAEEAAGETLPAAIARMSDRHWHSIAPALIERAVATSRHRMGLATLDAVLLHNPEYLLSPELSPGEPLEARREAFYAGVREAFEALEALVEQGRIGCYGVSSNTLGHAGETGTSLARFVAAAEAAGGAEHHFRIVQVPLNPAERTVVEGDPEAGGGAVLAACRRRGLGVLINRPLNAFWRGRLVRMAREPDPTRVDAFGPAGRRVAALEQRLGRDYRRRLPGTVPLTAWSAEIPRMMQRMRAAANYDDALVHVRSRLRRELAWLRERVPESEGWSAEYRQALGEMFDAGRHYMAAVDGPLVQEIVGRCAGFPAEGTLSQRTLRWVASREGVGCVLVGMRRPAYVDDVLGIRELGIEA